jgi:hypothetical protein
MPEDGSHRETEMCKTREFVDTVAFSHESFMSGFAKLRGSGASCHGHTVAHDEPRDGWLACRLRTCGRTLDLCSSWTG